MKTASEHFCTLFDIGFLPQGIVLARSLREHCPQNVLWVLCLDRETEYALSLLELPGVRAVALDTIETEGLLRAKANRTWGEYCWTLTPHLLRAALDFDGVERITYLDADLLIQSDPLELIHEMQSAGKSVLITPHDYGPGYGRPELFGTFCVQFLTATSTPEVRGLLERWAGQCRDWCFARKDGQGYGDQKYLDEWLSKFSSIVHVLCACHLAHGPWRHSLNPFSRRGTERHVFHHFHQLRIFDGGWVRLFRGYRIPPRLRGQSYDRVMTEIAAAAALMRSRGIPVRTRPLPSGLRGRIERLVLTVFDLEGWARLP